MEPIIKWTGSKRSQCKTIVDKFPKEINTYYEPFIGSAAVLFELLQRCEKSEIYCKKFICSDINEELIGTWDLIKDKPNYILVQYKELYSEFSNLDIQGKKDFYNDIKYKFNELKLNREYSDYYYLLFFWLRRTCFNGLVRYNSKGEFNAPCHFTRNGIIPAKLESVIFEWSTLLNKYNVQFVCRDYKDFCIFNNDDLLYLDPPYANTYGMYQEGSFNKSEFYKWVNTLPRYILSYDGKRNENDYTQNIEDMITFNEHLYLNSGKSSFSKFINYLLCIMYFFNLFSILITIKNNLFFCIMSCVLFYQFFWIVFAI